MIRGQVEKFTDAQIKILGIAGRKIAPDTDKIASSWAKKYYSFDRGRWLSRKQISALCKKETKGLIASLISGDTKISYRSIAKLGRQLSVLEIPFENISYLIHFLEGSYMQILSAKIAKKSELLQIISVVDKVFHNWFSILTHSYFETIKAKMTEEIGVGVALQKALLPKIPPKIKNMDIGIVYESATEFAHIGGDFYDFIEFPDGKIGILLGDVSGHGIKAAAYTAMVKFMIRAYAFEDNRPATVVSRLNKALDNYLEEGEFVTLIYAIFEPDKNLMTMTNAGHPLPVLHSEINRSCAIVTSHNPLVGVIKNANFEEHAIELLPDDSLILYTDGLIEARQNNELFGEKRIFNYCGSIGKISSQEWAENLYSEALNFAGGKLDDDIAIVVIRKK